MTSKINKNEHKVICEKYRSGMTCTEIAKEYSVSYGPILKILHANNEPVSYRKSNKEPQNRFNHEFFFKKNEKLAYFMGFALADGCLKNNPKRYSYLLKFSIAEKDMNILYMFCDWTGFDPNKITKSNSKIRKSINKTYICKPIYNLIYTEKKVFTQDFSEWGLVPNKTYVGAVPTITDKNIVIPFLLGLIDGDGCLTFTAKRKQFGLVSNKNIIIWCEQTLKKLGYNGTYQLIMPENKCYGRFLINRKDDIIKFGNILNIKNYPFIMERKWADLKSNL